MFTFRTLRNVNRYRFVIFKCFMLEQLNLTPQIVCVNIKGSYKSLAISYTIEHKMLKL